MSQKQQYSAWNRRQWLSASVAGMACGSKLSHAAEEPAAAPAERRGRILQSVCHWCFRPMPVEELARAAAALGMHSVELVDPEHWPLLKEMGLVCAITSSHGFMRGLNHKEHHDECLEKLRQSIDATSAAGFPNVITFSGMREGLTDEKGLANTVDGAKKIIGYAEKKGVNLCLEVLNSRVDVEMKGHPGYQADRIEWGVEVCRRVGSPRMKILFDIYHTQIMQGDLITRIQKFSEYIGHYHTAGVPGRNELDDRQEIQYPPIMKAIAETGYRGYVGHEFIPRADDKIATLRQAVELCDV